MRRGIRCFFLRISNNRTMRYCFMLCITERLCLLQIKARRMAIANGTCVSFCYQPKAHYLATSRESRRYVVAYSRFADAAFGHLATSGESKAHFGLHWVRPWDNRGKCYMHRKRIQCWSNASIYPSIFNRFWDIASYWSKIATFSYPTSV